MWVSHSCGATSTSPAPSGTRRTTSRPPSQTSASTQRYPLNESSESCSQVHQLCVVFFPLPRQWQNDELNILDICSHPEGGLASDNGNWWSATEETSIMLFCSHDMQLIDGLNKGGNIFIAPSLGPIRIVACKRHNHVSSRGSGELLFLHT